MATNATTKVTTAWGSAVVLDEVAVPQEADEREFTSLVQLLGGSDGERYVRFAYTTDGTARRGPVTFRAADVVRLRDELARHPELAAALGFGSLRKGGRRGKAG